VFNSLSVMYISLSVLNLRIILIIRSTARSRRVSKQRRYSSPNQWKGM